MHAYDDELCAGTEDETAGTDEETGEVGTLETEVLPYDGGVLLLCDGAVDDEEPQWKPTLWTPIEQPPG